MPYCSECGSEIEGSEKFCPECGTQVGKKDVSHPTTKDETTSEEPDKKIESSEEGRNETEITLGKIAGYAVGVLLILAGLGGFADNSVGAGVLLLIGGLIALPIVRTKINEETGVSLSRWATVAIVLVATFSGAALLEDVQQQTSPEEPIGESPENLMIEVGDLPSGWGMGYIEENPDGVDADIRGVFGKMDDTPQILIVELTVYDSIEEAQNAYQQRESNIRERISVSDRSIGHGAISWESGGDNAIVFFRDSEVVAKVIYSEDFGFNIEETAVSMAKRVQNNF